MYDPFYWYEIELDDEYLNNLGKDEDMKVDWQTYHEIEKKPAKERTDEEKDFYRFMYQLEEIQAGLDCER